MVVNVQRTEPTTAVCVVRIERQPTRPLITIRINYDITRVSTDAVRVMADAEAALEAVRDFLDMHQENASRPRRGVTPW